MDNLVSDNSFNKFFQNSIELLCITDRKGIFIKLNPVWEEMLTYKISELKGISYFELIHPDDLKKTEESILELQQNRAAIKFTNRCRHKDGTYRWVEWRAFAEDEKLYLSGYDISKLKKSEEEFRHTNIVQQTVIESVTVGMVLAKDGNFEWANNAFLKMFKCTLNEIKGQPINLFFKNKKDITRITEEAFKCFQKEKPYKQDIEVTIKDNSISWIHANIKMLTENKNEGDAVWIIKDISATKAITSNVKESEKQIQSIAENIPGILFQFYYDENHKMGLNYVHGKSKKYLHLDNNDIDTFLDRFIARIPAEEQSSFLSSIKNAIEAEINWHWVGTFFLSDGTKRILEGRSHPRHLNKQLVFDGFIVDVSDVKESEWDIAKGEAILESTLESINSAILIVGDNSDILHYNNSFAVLFNIPQDLLLTKNDKLLINHAKSQLKDPDEFVKKINEIYQKNSYAQDVIYFKNGHIINRQFFPLIQESPVKVGVWTFTDITQEKQDEETLELFKTSIDNSVEEIYWLNKDGSFEYINEMACKNLGYTREELLNLTIFDIDPSIPKKIWYEQWNNLKKRREITKAGDIFETTNQRKDGSVYPVEVSFIHLRIENKEYRISHVRDISNRKKEEEVLRRSEEKYRLLFENMTSSFALHKMIYDNKGNPTDYRYIEVNPSFEKQSGIKAENLIGKTVKEILPETEDYWIETFGNVVKTGKPIHYINYSKELNKHFETLTFCPEKDHFAVLFNDVTERINNEESLNLFKLTTDYSSEAVYWFAPDAKFIYANDGACKMLGYSKEELLSMKVFDIDPIYPKKVWKKNWEDYRSNKKEKTLKVETVHKRKDGSFVNVDIVTSFLTINNKEFQIAHGRDITERVKDDEILNKFKASIDYSQDGVFWINEKSGFDYVNEQACKMLGYNQEELLQLKISDIDPFVAHEEFKILWNRLFTNKTFDAFSIESKHKRKDGSIFPVELNSVFAWIDNKGLLISYVKDISKRKQYEETLLKNQKILKDSQRVAKMGSWENFVIEKRFIWQEEIYHLLGYEYEEIELTYENFRKLVYPDDLPDLIATNKQIIETKKFIEHEYRAIRKDGNHRLVHVYGDVILDDKKNVISTYGIVQDITEQRKNEEILYLFKKSIDNANDAVFWHNKEGRFIYVNDKACKMLGYTRDELMRLTLFDIDPEYSKQDLDKTWKGYQINKEKGSISHRLESVHKRKDGTIYPVEISVTHFWVNDKEHHITYVQDITERKQYEERILENQKLLNESQRISKSGSWEVTLEDNHVKWSNSMYQLHGLNKKTFKLTHENYLKLIHPDDRQSVIKNIAEATENGTIDNDEYRIVKPNGEIRTLITSAEILKDNKNKPVKIIGVVQDITESKIAKEALIASEERARLFVENTPLPMALFDTNMCYIIASKQWYVAYKVENKDLKGLYHYDIFPETTKRWKDLHQRAIKGEIIKCDKDKFVRQDGSIQWVRYELHPWYKGDRSIGGMVAFTEDITEKVKTAEALKETEQKMQRIFEFAPICIGLLDNRIVVDVNSQISTLTWYKKEELIGKKTEIVFPSKKEYEKVGKVMYQQLEKEGFSEYESFWKRKDGKLINVYLALTYLDPEDPSKGVLFSGVDITKQKKIEEHLRKEKERAEESEYFLQQSQRSGNIGSYKLNIKTQNWISTKILNKIFGITDSYKRDFDGWMSIVHPDDKENVQKIMETEVLVKKQTFNFEYRIIRKNDKKLRWVHSIGKIYDDKDGNPAEMLGTIQDITDRRLIEEERRMMNIELENRVKERTSQLQQANKDLESFAYSVSHDLRAPIRHINGFMNLLERAMNSSDSKIQEYIDKIFLSSKNMSIMIDELLKFSRLGRTDLKRTKVDLSIIVNEVVTQLKPDYEGRNIQWKISDLPIVDGDPTLLKIVFENLISNAIKYTAKTEEAVIEIGEKEKCNANKICIYIKDNGVGFNMAYKDKLFDVFQRLHKKEEFEGTGVGLANVKKIIKKHNGKIDAIAESNNGATFFITLPK